MSLYVRRKCRSQTSDNMERWKSRGGKSQRGEEQQREDQRGGRVRRKEMQVCEKVGKSRFTVFVQWFVALKGRTVGSLKRRVRSHLGRWEMNNYTPLWREAHFGSQHVQSIPFSEHFWKLTSSKSTRSCRRKHISKSKCYKHHGRVLKDQMWFCVGGARDSAPCQKWLFVRFF